MVELRDYQKDTISQLYEAWRKYNRVVACLPTGAGKTTTAGHIIYRAVNKKAKVGVIVHRDELVSQFSSRLKSQFQLLPGIIKSGKPSYPNRLVQVISLMSLNLNSLPEFDVIFIDEGHRSKGNTYESIIKRYPHAKISALTATPFRNDGRGLGDIFEYLIHPIKISELMNRGYLVDTRVFYPDTSALADLENISIGKYGEFTKGSMFDAFDKSVLYDGVITNYQKNAAGTRAFCFNVNIEHSKKMNAHFNEAGILSEHIDGTTAKSLRRRRYEQFKRGEIMVLNNVDLFTEGKNVPAVETIIINRAIKSLNLYVQVVGRGLRPYPGKTHCIVLDHGDNTFRHGPIRFYDANGFTLETSKQSNGEKEEKERCKICPECSMANEVSAVMCANENCTHIFEVRFSFDTVESNEFLELNQQELMLDKIQSYSPLDYGKIPLEFVRLHAILTGKHWKWAYHLSYHNNLFIKTYAYESGDSLKEWRFQCMAAEEKSGTAKLFKIARSKAKVNG